MYKKFLETVLPSQGNYCVFTLKDTKPKLRFVENASLEKTFAEIEKLREPGRNIYFALASFSGMARKANESIYLKSFFVDLDVGKVNNSYDTQEEAFVALAKFIKDTGLPEPVVVDSGNGVHAYWILNEQIETSEWLPYAKRFKELCYDKNLIIDPDVPADAARVLRVPGTKNYGKHYQEGDEGKDVVLLTDVFTYDLQDIVSHLGEIKKEPETFNFKDVRKGLTEDERKLLGLDNYEYDFSKIAIESIEGRGCNQIKWILENATTCPEPLWYAGLSVAVRCVDGDTAIHGMSEGHPDYSPDNTEKKAQQSLENARWAHTCEKFEEENPGGCDGCPFKGRIKCPIEIGKRLRIAQPGSDAPAETTESEVITTEPDKFPGEYRVFPQGVFPFIRPVGGGVWYQPPPKVKKDGTTVTEPPYMLYPYDLIPIKRLISPYDGACLHLRVFLPKDGVHDHVMPLSFLGSVDKFKDFLFRNNILLTDTKVPLMKEYLMKWGNYLVNAQKAEDMRIQMGWTTNPERGSFVVGTTEITPKGDFDCPISSITRNVVPHLHEKGEFKVWQDTANKILNEPNLRHHVIGLLVGIGSPLITFSNVGGLVVSLSGPKGSGKTGAMISGLSIFGQPKMQMITTSDGATDNGLYQRASILNSIMLGIDETSNFDPKVISNAIYRLPMNEQGKLRVQTSYNNERKTMVGSKMITLLTTNNSNKQKLYETGKADPGGELRRMVEFDLLRYRGLFTDSEGKELFEPFNHNYGHAGPELIRAFYHYGLPYVQQRYDYWHERFLRDFVNDTAYTYWNAGLAACYAGAEIAVRAGILDFDVDNHMHFIVENLHWQHKNMNSDKITHEDIVNDYVLSNINSLLAINNDKVSIEPRSGSLLIRCEVETGKVFITGEPFREYLSKRRVNISEFELELMKKGVLLQKSVKKRMASNWKEATGAFNVRAYEFKMDVSDVISDATQET
jgi:hypothetical protein